MWSVLIFTLYQILLGQQNKKKRAIHVVLIGDKTNAYRVSVGKPEGKRTGRSSCR